MNERLLTREEAAAFLAVPPKSLAEWAYRGEGPPYFRVGRHTRYSTTELVSWLESRRAMPRVGGVEKNRSPLPPPREESS